MISIIIPIYNVEEYIEDCIISLINQTVSDFEVIFVDDCGSDKSISIVKKYINKNILKNAKLIHRDNNGGLSAARNTGIKAATGNYLLFIDSDDYLVNIAIESFYKVINITNTYDIVISNYRTTTKKSCIINKVKDCLVGNKKIRNAYYNNKIIITAWNKLVRKNFIIDNNLFFQEGIIHEDILWTYKCIHKANYLFAIKPITYIYRIRENSIMTCKYGEKNITSLILILKEMKFMTLNKSGNIFFYNKKILEFTITVFSKASILDFYNYCNILNTSDLLIKNSINIISLLNYLILKFPRWIGRSILTILLNTKFKYLK